MPANGLPDASSNSSRRISGTRTHGKPTGGPWVCFWPGAMRPATGNHRSGERCRRCGKAAGGRHGEAKRKATPRGLHFARSSLIPFLPVSSQSTDLPNSRLMAKSTDAPGSLSPCSNAERWLCAVPMRRANSSCVMPKPRSSRILLPIAPRSSWAFCLDFRVDFFILIKIKYR